MNVRLTPLAHPNRTILHGGVRRIVVEGNCVKLLKLNGTEDWLPRRDYSRIDVDNDPGGFD